MNVLPYPILLSYLDIYKDKLSDLELFIKDYNSIIKLDKEKPRFSLTKRYSKFPKYQKFQRSSKYVKLKRGDNVWTPKIKMEISNKIKTILNKLTEHNYKKLCNKLLIEIKSLDNLSVFDILNKEIMEKCTFDKEFHYIYIHLCDILWDSTDIYNNYISINNKTDKYYWNINSETTVYGPFNTKEDLTKDVNDKLSYKSKFINYFISEFKKKNIIYKEIQEGKIVGDAIYKEKIKIQSILQFMFKLHNCDKINSTYLNQIFNFIFSENIVTHDIIYLYNSLPILNNYDNINYYIMLFKKKINQMELEKRIKFFADQICNLSTNTDKEEELEYDDYINIYIKKNISLEGLLERLNNSYEIILSEMFYNYQKYQIYIDIIKDSYNKELLNIDGIKESLYTIIQEYDDLKLDIPKINIYFINLLNELSKISDTIICDNTLITNINNFIEETSKNELYNMIISDCNAVPDEVYEMISKESV